MPKIKNKHFTKELIINDYNQTKERLGKNRLGREEYIANGQYTRSNITKAFGNWNNMKKEIGERPLVNKKLSKEDVSQMAYTLFDKHGKLTAEIMRDEGYSQPAVDRSFGSFSRMMDELSLPQEAIGKTRQLTDEQFLLELVKIEKDYGYVNYSLLQKHSLIPFASFLNRYKTFGEACLLAGVRHLGEDTIIRPFGEVNKALNEIAEYLDEKDFHTEMTFDWLRNDENNSPFPVDAYFPKNNLIVEYHGPRHYDVNFWLNTIKTSNGIEEVKRRDALKRNLVKQNGYSFVEIYDYEKENVVEVFKSRMYQ